MKGKTFFKRFRKLLLWTFLFAVIYCWNKPQTYSVLVIIYMIFLILNRYYSYLEEQECERERLGKKFQKNKFYEQYRKEKQALIRMEMMIIIMLLFLLQFYNKT